MTKGNIYLIPNTLGEDNFSEMYYLQMLLKSLSHLITLL